MHDETRALSTLVRAYPPGPGARALLDRLGSAGAVLAAGAGTWADAGLPARSIALLDRPDAANLRVDRHWLDGGRRRVIGWHDADYPALLRTIADPPLALFVEGDPALLWHPHVAVVGSRRATHAGMDNARAFAREFAGAGLGVASGLAAGVDTAAHHGALDAGGPTVAVVGCGLDIVFPRANVALAARIAAAGAIVSEYPPGTPPLSDHFPARNRLIAGLALGTLVVEAAERSGALITARLAADAGREVFALPGSIHNPQARGCHRLIRLGVALVESPAEIVAALGPVAACLGEALRGRLEPPPAPVARVEQAGIGIDPSLKCVLDALGHDAVNLDQLVGRTGLTLADLAPMLLAMELDGRVIAENGRYVRRT
jgi:DNA processing protein